LCGRAQGRSVQVYLFDINQKQRIVKKNDWANKKGKRGGEAVKKTSKAQVVSFITFHRWSEWQETGGRARRGRNTSENIFLKTNDSKKTAVFSGKCAFVLLPWPTPNKDMALL